jgi:hypothetical protein
VNNISCTPVCKGFCWHAHSLSQGRKSYDSLRTFASLYTTSPVRPPPAAAPPWARGPPPCPYSNRPLKPLTPLTAHWYIVPRNPLINLVSNMRSAIDLYMPMASHLCARRQQQLHRGRVARLRRVLQRRDLHRVHHLRARARRQQHLHHLVLPELQPRFRVCQPQPAAFRFPATRLNATNSTKTTISRKPLQTLQEPIFAPALNLQSRWRLSKQPFSP